METIIIHYIGLLCCYGLRVGVVPKEFRYFLYMQLVDDGYLDYVM